MAFGISKIVVRFVSIALLTYYILSSMGWFFATYLALSGKMPLDPVKHAGTLTTFALFARTSQIVTVLSASVALVREKLVAVNLFFACFALGMTAFIFNGSYGVSFLHPLFLLPVCLYLIFIKRKGFLH